MDRLHRYVMSRSSPLTPDEVARRINAALAPDERTFSVARALQAAYTDRGLFERLSIEGEVCAQAARDAGEAHNPHRFRIPLRHLAHRDLTVAAASGGGYLVGDEAAIIAEPILGYSVVRQAGATLHTGLRGDVPVPKLLGDPTAYWLSTEGSTTTEGGMTFGMSVLQPKTVGAYVEVSDRLMRQAPNIDEFLRRVLSRTAARAIDIGCLAGSGTAGQPTGIANTVGIGTATGSSLNWAGIMTARASSVAANGDDRRLKWIGGATAQSTLGGREKAAGSGMIWGWDRSQQCGEIAGHAAFATSSCTADSLFLGDWSQMQVGFWGDSIVVEVNPFANFQAGIRGFRVLATVDMAPTSAAYFSAITSIT